MVISFIALFAVRPVSAQTWSFTQLEQEAIVSHPSVMGKKSAAAAAFADVDVAKWQRFPTPGVTSSRDNLGNSSTLTSLQQPLWTGGHITASIDAAQFRYSAADKAIYESQQLVIEQIINAYVDAVRWQTKKEVGERTVFQHQQLLDMISRRVKADASPSVDKDLAESRLYQANNDLSVAAQSLANALTQLSQLVGKSVSGVLSLNAEDIHVPPNKDTALKQAIDWSPILARLSFEENAAGSDVDIQKSALWPQVAVRYENQQGNTLTTTTPFSNRIMAVVDTQFGAGFSASAGISAALNKREAARQEKEGAVRDLQQKVSIDWDNLAVARLQYMNATKASTSSKEVFDSYTRQFVSAGKKSWLDVMNTVREASQYELVVLDTKAQMLGAALRLNLWTGNLNSLISH